MIYDILPTENLKAEDIRDTLNAGGGSVGNDTTTFFTTSAKINMWSKHKPVALPTDFCQDFDSAKPNYMAEWWRGQNNDCGITIPVYNTMDAVGEATNGTLNGWSYTLPSGGASQPFRLGDFAKYSRLADAPYKNFTLPERAGKNETITAMFEVNINSVDGTSLALSDLGSLENCYLGVKIVSTTGVEYWNTSKKTIKEDNTGQVTITLPSVLGTWKAFPFLSSAQQPQGGSINGASFYTIPMVDWVEFYIVDSVDAIAVYAQYFTTTDEFGLEVDKVRFKFTFTNNSNATGIFDNNQVSLSETQNGTALYSTPIPDFTCEVGETYNYPKDYNGDEWMETTYTGTDANWIMLGIDGRTTSSQIIKLAGV